MQFLCRELYYNRELVLRDIVYQACKAIQCLQSVFVFCPVPHFTALYFRSTDIMRRCFRL